LLLTVALLILALIPDSWQAALRYSRSGIEQGYYWQLFSGHLLHSNYWHLLMNLAGLMLVMLLHGRYWRGGQLLAQWLLYALVISLALYFASAELQIYVGLSAMLHAMLTQGAIKDIQLRQTGGALLLGGLLGKVLWEQWHGPDADLSQLINASVAIDAHLYGVISGLSLGLLSYIPGLLSNHKPGQ
jgi:rhomboid family GlyGly-CTERM serine protease